MLNIKPANPTEQLILSDPDFITGTQWGKPRKGHPEGKVANHIEEVMANVNFIQPNLTPKMYSDLRLITLVHDTFKYQNGGDHPHTAWEFTKHYTTDKHVLDVILTHDDAYRIWKRSNNKIADLAVLKTRLGEAFKLYVNFYFCDTCTGNKNLSPVFWLIENWQLEPSEKCMELIQQHQSKN